jgi:transposase
MGDVRSARSLIEKLPKVALVLADTADDSDKFRKFLITRSSIPVIKPNSTRKNIPPFDEVSYKGRNVIERAFSHLKDWRRVATRYDKLARNAPPSLWPYSSGGGSLIGSGAQGFAGVA